MPDVSHSAEVTGSSQQFTAGEKGPEALFSSILQCHASTLDSSSERAAVLHTKALLTRVRLEKEDAGTHTTLTFKDIAPSQEDLVCVSHSLVGHFIV